MDHDQFVAETQRLGQIFQQVAADSEERISASLEKRLRAAAQERDRLRAELSSRAATGLSPGFYQSASGHSAARERDDAARIEDRLTEITRNAQLAFAELRHDVMALRKELITLRKQAATKVEVESLDDKITAIGDGFVHTQERLLEVAELIRRHL